MAEPSRPPQKYDTTALRLVGISPSAGPEEIERAQGLEIEKLHQLLELARGLGTQTNFDLLMNEIVVRTSRIMNCERSSVFLLDRDRQELYTVVAQGLLDSKEIRIPATTGLVGAVARSGQILNVPDAYQDPRFNQDVDRRTGLRTRSVLALAMRDRRSRVLGVLQCLNKRLPSGQQTVFDETDEKFGLALAGLCASFLENAKLYRDMDRLFEAMVSAFSRAIDDRDPCTSGHTRRVTLLALNLARAVHSCQKPPFDEIRYTRERMRQLRYAGLLHDIGKIGVREHILNKGQKLPVLGPEIIQARLALVREKLRSETLVRACVQKRDPQAALDRDFEPLAREIEQAMALIQAKNNAGPVTPEELALLNDCQRRGWISERERECLSIKAGTLTADEWRDMQSHVVKTWEMLHRIPWPDELKDVPEVAWTHHERLDGSGYPRHLKGDEITFDGHILAIADVYDALTAADRPYKKAMSHERARQILLEQAEQKGMLRPALVQLFFEAKCYLLDAGEVRAAEQGAFRSSNVLETTNLDPAVRK